MAEPRPHSVRQSIDLGEALCQAMRHAHVPATKLAHQLHVMVAGDTVRGTGRYHVVHEPNRIEDVRATVHEVADEHRLPAQRMRIDWPTTERPQPSRYSGRDLVTQLTQKSYQFITAAMKIPNDVEGAVVVALVVVERYALNRCGFDFLRVLQHEDVPEALFGKSTE